MTLRKADQDELIASTGMKPLDALVYSARNSLWTDVAWEEDTGEIIVVFGLANINDVGIPWLVMNPTFKKYKKLFQRHSKKIIKEMLGTFPFIFNYTDSRNVVHIHWLKYMGFKFNKERDQVFSGIPFKYFYMER